VGVDQVPTIKTVDYQGRKVRGEVVGFTQAVPEAWNEYNFSDGSSLRMRSSLLEVVRLLDEYGPNGDPIYVFTAQQLANITAAENLKQVRG
jgi:hypothetical protein